MEQVEVNVPSSRTCPMTRGRRSLPAIVCALLMACHGETPLPELDHGPWGLCPEHPTAPIAFLAFRDHGAVSGGVEGFFTDVATIAEGWLDEACLAECGEGNCTLACDTEAGARVEYQWYPDAASGSETENIVVYPPDGSWTRLSFSQTMASGKEDGVWTSWQWAAEWEGTLSNAWPPDGAISGSVSSIVRSSGNFAEGSDSQERTSIWDDGACAWSLAHSTSEWRSEGDSDSYEGWSISANGSTLDVEADSWDDCVASLNGSPDWRLDCRTWFGIPFYGETR